MLPGVVAASSGVVNTDGWHLTGPGERSPLEENPAPAGDVDGDGVLDVVVAAVGAEDGVVYVVSGLDLGPNVAVDAGPLAVWEAVDEAGIERVTAVGDLDGDGLDDLALTYVSSSDTGNGPLVSGQVRLLYAAAGGGSVDDAARLVSGTANGNEDVRVVGLGDLDGDGRDELAVGYNIEQQLIAVVPGAALPTTGELDIGPYVLDTGLGTPVACDLDGDGLLDLLWGLRDDAPTSGGMFWSGATLLDGAPPVEITFPDGASCAGDLDGDGLSDLVFGDRFGGG